MRVKIEQVAEIRTGYAFRGAVNKIKGGARPLVQMRDFNTLRDDCFESVRLRSPRQTRSD